MATPPSKVEMEAYMAKEVESTFAALLDSEEIALETQYQLALAGYKSSRRFAGYDEARQQVREGLQKDLEIEAGTAAGRLTLSKLVSLWETVREQQTVDNNLRAQHKAAGTTKAISCTDKVQMRKAVEAKYGRRAEEEQPAVSYLSEKLEEVENGEPTASKLDEIISALDGDAYTLGAGLDLSGKVQIVRKKCKSNMPASTEQFRAKLKVECNTWLYLACKFVNHGWLKNLTPEHFRDWTEYFMGEKVMQFTVNGTTPSWTDVLEYEYRCRKLAFRQVREEGLSLADALRHARGDQEVRGLYFTAQLVAEVTGGKRAGPPGLAERPAQAKYGKTSGKGQGRLAGATPDGRQICFAYNNEGCREQACSRSHVCRICYGSHPMSGCNKAKGKGKGKRKGSRKGRGKGKPGGGSGAAEQAGPEGQGS
jgi:hypothetical protein